MKILSCFMILLIVFCATTQSQDKIVGGPCEGCEAIYEFPLGEMNHVDTIPGFSSANRKMYISGTVYRPDGITLAPDVILYVYQTNQSGIYQPGNSPEGWERRHGIHRGWIKTGTNGTYEFYTFVPGSYPNTSNPQHIHVTVKEPGYSEYYIDSFHFTDDPLLTKEEISNQKQRGGNGVVTPKLSKHLWIVNRDIILGKNIPGYR